MNHQEVIDLLRTRGIRPTNPIEIISWNENKDKSKMFIRVAGTLEVSLYWRDLTFQNVLESKSSGDKKK